jgi:hypothetical protein
VFQGKVKWLLDEKGRLLVQLTTTGEGWIAPPIKFLHHLRMLPETAVLIGEALMWIGEEALHERDCKGRADCRHKQHVGDLRDAARRDKERQKRGYGRADTDEGDAA